MKRFADDVVGRPVLRTPRRDVAGAPIHSPVVDVASYLNAFDATPDPADFDSALAADFADFLAPELEEDDELQPPDPLFRERLRRQLWRVYVQTHLRDRPEPH